MNGLFDGLFDGVAEAGPGVAIRATVLLAVAAVVSLAMARASAAQRHLVWVAALTAAMVLPAIHAWGPEWSVWPAGMTYRYGAMSERGEAATRLDRTMVDDRLQVDPLLHDPVPDEPADDDDQTTTASHAGFSAAGDSGRVEATSPAIAMPAGSSRTVSLTHGLAAVWLVGMVYGCARLAVAYAGIRQLARHADPVGERTAAMIAELAAAAGIRRRVRGLVSRESIVPMTWGWLRPVVLLPVEAGSWSAERLQVVLQHELAHVSRWDALTQFVAELARSVYWFHPLAWWSVRRLRADQEAACDDCVLAAGAAADDYAEELLAVTARLPRGAYGLQGMGVAVAMGRAGRLEERVRALLAFDRDRRPVNPWRAAAVASVLAAVATLAAVIGPAADAEDKAASGPAEPSASADDELPGDTNQIKSLTPEQARKLAKECPGVEVKYYTKGWGDLTTPNALPLKCLTSLDAATAKALAGYNRGPLWLDGLTTLNAPAAQALAEFTGDWLQLNGLTKLDADTARALAVYTGHYLQLDGLTSLDVETARALAAFRGRNFSLRGLTALDVEVARALAASQAWQGPGGAVTMLSVEAAEALGGFKGLNLALNGLTEISPEVARALGQYRGTNLYLNGLTAVSADAACGLAGFSGPGSMLQMSGMRALPADVAREIAAFRGRRLDLDGVTALDADAARALAGFKGQFLNLNGLPTLSAATAAQLLTFKGEQLRLDSFWAAVGKKPPLTLEMARAIAGFLCRSRHPVSLPGVTAFETPDAVAVATALATATAPLALPNLKTISPKTLSALLEKEDIEIPLIETLELIPEPDGSPTDDFVVPDGFQGR